MSEETQERNPICDEFEDGVGDGDGTEAEVDDGAGTGESHKLQLEEEESRGLQQRLKSILHSSSQSATEDDAEDIADLIEYTMAMIQNGNTTEFVVRELLAMEMEICSEEKASAVGQVLNDFMKQRANGSSICDKQSKQKINALTKAGALGSDRKYSEKEKQVGVKVTEESPKKNALVMSGALEAPRKGEQRAKKDLAQVKSRIEKRKQQKQQQKQQQDQNSGAGRNVRGRVDKRHNHKNKRFIYDMEDDQVVSKDSRDQRKVLPARAASGVNGVDGVTGGIGVRLNELRTVGGAASGRDNMKGPNGRLSAKPRTPDSRGRGGSTRENPEWRRQNSQDLYDNPNRKRNMAIEALDRSSHKNNEGHIFKKPRGTRSSHDSNSAAIIEPGRAQGTQNFSSRGSIGRNIETEPPPMQHSRNKQQEYKRVDVGAQEELLVPNKDRNDAYYGVVRKTGDRGDRGFPDQGARGYGDGNLLSGRGTFRRGGRGGGGRSTYDETSANTRGLRWGANENDGPGASIPHFRGGRGGRVIAAPEPNLPVMARKMTYIRNKDKDDPNQPQATNPTSGVVSVLNHPSPIVQDTFGRGGDAGLHRAGRGRGRGPFAGRFHSANSHYEVVAQKVAQKKWVRQKPSNEEDYEPEASQGE